MINYPRRPRGLTSAGAQEAKPCREDGFASSHYLQRIHARISPNWIHIQIHVDPTLGFVLGLGFTFRFAFLESWRLYYMHHRRRIAFSFGFKFGVFTNGVDKGQRSELCMSCLFGRALEQWRLHFRSLRHGRACVQSRHL